MVNRLKVLIPLCLLMFAGMASADVNLFNYTGITIIPPSNSAIAPWSDTCPPYPACNVSPSTGYYPDGFPLLNMFGQHEQTAEGDYDAIFNGTSTYEGETYDNVYFTTSSPITYIGNIFVDGSQDGASSNRSFYEFLLWTFANVDGPYTLLYAGTPTLNPTTGYESLSGYVGAVNPGSNFVVQFLTNSTSGVRVFDVVATAAEPVDFLSVIPLFMLAGSALVARRRTGTA